MEIENDFDGQLVWEENAELPTTMKQEKQVHGIGLDNIRRCARKYLGDAEIRVMDQGQGKVFQLTVMLYRKPSVPPRSET